MFRFDPTSENYFYSEESLADGVQIHDVYFSENESLIAVAPTKLVAEELADALNKIRNRFLDCGSEREAISLATALSTFIERPSKDHA